MASGGMSGSGVGTSSMGTVEGVSHGPGQEGDASNCSDMKEWGCGLWRRVLLSSAPPRS